MHQQNPTPLSLFLVGVAERKEKLSDQTDLFFCGGGGGVLLQESGAFFGGGRGG